MPLDSGTPSMGLEPIAGRHASSPVRPAWPARRRAKTTAPLTDTGALSTTAVWPLAAWPRHTDLVAKEDQVEMTHKVCFELCRTVPTLGFFGFVNGRDCYGTPHFSRWKGTAPSVTPFVKKKDAVVWRLSKSSVFARHMCGSTQDVWALGQIHQEPCRQHGRQVKTAKVLVKDMQNPGAAPEAFGVVGDSGASGLMQSAMCWWASGCTTPTTPSKWRANVALW